MSKGGGYIEHDIRVVIDRYKVRDIIAKDPEIKTLKGLYDRSLAYGINWKMGTFRNMMGNVNEWKLLYAYIIADILKVNITDIFELEPNED